MKQWSSIERLKESSFGEVMELAFSEPVLTWLESIDKVYVYKTDNKYFELNKNIPSDILWACLKVHRFFKAEPLPFQIHQQVLSYGLPLGIQESLSQLDRVCSTPTSPKQLSSTVWNEAVRSCRLDGVIIGLEEGAQLLERGQSPKTPSEQWLVNQAKLLFQLNDWRGRELNESIINDIYQLLVINVAGPILQVERESATEEEFWKLQIDTLIFWLNSKKTFIHPMVSAVLLYFCFDHYQPFGRLSGRMGRALVSWWLLKNGYPLFQSLSLSEEFESQKFNLEKALKLSLADEGDLTYYLNQWMNIFLQVFNKSYEIDDEIDQDNSKNIVFFSHFPNLNSRQQQLLLTAIDFPEQEFTIQSHQNRYSIVYETARTDLRKLEKEGLLTRKMRAQEFVFLPVDRLEEKIKGEVNVS